MKNILWFSEINKENVPQVGGKGANLGEMYNIKLPIPPGFIVSAGAYKKFLEKTGIKEKILSLLKNIDMGDTEKIHDASEKIQEIILDAKMPEEIKEDITNAYDTMNVDIDVYKSLSKDALKIIKAGRDLPFVAVRSSATAEDLPEASFAGQQATFLNVKGNEKLVNAVQQCWASLFTARAIYYRQKNNFPHEKVLIAVVVQKMINSDSSGVMFTINPSTNDENEIVIETGFGLGESIVGGEITPDSYIVDKNELKIKSKKINKQKFMYTRDENVGRTIKKNLSAEKGSVQKITDDQIIKLAEYGKNIDEHYGKPMDIEYAVENNKLFIVQARPVTTQKRVGERKEEKLEEKGKKLLSGLAASPGIATGRVKIVHDITELKKVERGDILVARMTDPDMVPAMEKAIAIVTDEGGNTSHASIISRELGIACIVGTEKATQVLKDGDLITVDGTNGNVYEGKVEIKQKEVVEEALDVETITKVKVNCDIPSQSSRAAKTGADGIGLFRIEFIIAENGIHPTKYIRDGKDDEYTEMLYKGIKETAWHFKGKPIWVRTSDIRTDEYRNLEGGSEEPNESNPMLGWHGIRRSLDDAEILKAEFRAIKRLHDEGFKNLGVMIPFVISVDEIKRSKKIMEEVGLEPLKDIEFGVMCETPACVWIIEDLCNEGISFVSFGTNDLTQTTLGIDRNNERLQKWYNELHPAVLRSIEHVIKACKKYNVITSICGQAGSNPKMAEELVRFGIDSISANIDAVGLIRNTVSNIEKKMLLDAARKRL